MKRVDLCSLHIYWHSWVAEAKNKNKNGSCLGFLAGLTSAVKDSWSKDYFSCWAIYLGGCLRKVKDQKRIMAKIRTHHDLPMLWIKNAVNANLFCLPGEKILVALQFKEYKKFRRQNVSTRAQCHICLGCYYERFR